ncbi:MAG: glycosyltransferase, partial [Hyphomonadaceae bacterium]
MKRKLLFVATEDWFVRSHFMPMVRRAVADGFDTVIAARMGEARADLIAAGARVVDFGDARGAYDPATITRSVGRLRSVIDAERPDIVHAIALRPILLTALAVRGKRGVGTVFAVTGRGYLAMTRSWPMQRALDIIAGLIARAVRGGTGVLLVENTHDRDWVAGARPLPEARIVLTPGAGVDLTHYNASPPPPAPPVRIGCVTRLVRSKGVDVLVEAVGHLRASGRDVEAVIAGAPDPDNPSSVSAEELARWRALPAIDLPGRVSDVNAFWAGMHIACLPSRGGEGLPRSLLEA